MVVWWAVRSRLSGLLLCGCASLLVRCSGEADPAATGSAGGASGGAAPRPSAPAGNADNAGGASAGDAGQGGAGPYLLLPFDKVRITSDATSPHFQGVSAAIDLRDGPFEQVNIGVELRSPCYPFESWPSLEAGQFFPPECDAFSRTFSLLLDPPQQEGDPPPFELIRAATPYGGPLVVSADITDLANARPGKHTLHAHVGTWADPTGQTSGIRGGWDVSVKIVAQPGKPPRNVLAATPLLRGPQQDAQPGAAVPLAVPEGTSQARIEYRASGFGSGPGDAGCKGPAEEFCKRRHEFYLDGKKIKSSYLWRDDCADLCTIAHHEDPTWSHDYCLQNPTGAPEGVKQSRANWCPGSEVWPLQIQSEPLGAPGEHLFWYQIPKLAEGGWWLVSATFYAYSG